MLQKNLSKIPFYEKIKMTTKAHWWLSPSLAYRIVSAITCKVEKNIFQNF
jgi:hypothetical protein